MRASPVVAIISKRGLWPYVYDLPIQQEDAAIVPDACTFRRVSHHRNISGAGSAEVDSGYRQLSEWLDSGYLCE